VQTTIADPAAAKARDLIGRDFTAPAVNERYVGDLTQWPVGERGFLYLATVIDLHSRRLAGWAIADHERQPAKRRAPGPGKLPLGSIKFAAQSLLGAQRGKSP
jgi:transposase InsO family protein